MKKHRQSKKLQVAVESIRSLSEPALEHVAGGTVNSVCWCDSTRAMVSLKSCYAGCTKN